MCHGEAHIFILGVKLPGFEKLARGHGNSKLRRQSRYRHPLQFPKPVSHERRSWPYRPIPADGVPFSFGFCDAGNVQMYALPGADQEDSEAAPWYFGCGPLIVAGDPSDALRCVVAHSAFAGGQLPRT